MLFFFFPTNVIQRLYVGRIGRIVYRNALELQDINVVAINEYVAICYRVYFSNSIDPRYSPFIDLEYMVCSIGLVHVADINYFF